MSSRGGQEADVERAKEVVRSLSLAAAIYRLYPSPFGQPAFQRSVQALSELNIDESSFQFSIARDHFLYGDEKLESEDPSVEWLANSLFELEISEIHLRAAPEAIEVVAFADLATSDAAQIEEEGGPKTFLRNRNVTAIQIVPRRLRVEERGPDSGRVQDLPEVLKGLIGDPRQLAQEIEASITAEETFHHLQTLYQQGLALDVPSRIVSAALADTLVALSVERRGYVLEDAFNAFSDPFAVNLVGQLSDSEVAETFRHMASRITADRLMEYSLEIVDMSGGRRTELPSVVAKRLVDAEFDRDEVFEAFATAWGTRTRLPGPSSPTPALTLRDAETLPDLDALRAEAEAGYGDDGFDVGLRLFRLLLSGAELGDAESLAELAEYIVTQHVESGRSQQALQLIEAVLESAGSATDSLKKERLERALKTAISRELISILLAGQDQEWLLRRMLDSLRERTVPALVAQLGAEQSRQKRRTLIDLLAEVASSDPSDVIGAIEDPRWFLVRNLVTVLGRIRDPRNLPAVLHAISHEDPRVRREAARALATFGNAAIPALSSAIHDSDELVRIAAVGSLGSVSHPDATRILAAAINRSSLGIKERKEALHSLRSQGTEEAREVLLKISRRRWPPTSATRELASHARFLLERPA